MTTSPGPRSRFSRPSQDSQHARHGRTWIRRALVALGVLFALAIVTGLSLWSIAKPAIGGHMDDAREARYRGSPEWSDGKCRNRRPRHDAPYLESLAKFTFCLLYTSPS